MSSVSRVCAVAAAVAGLTGCGGGPHPVSGQVVYDDGKPAAELSGWSVVFENPELKVSSSGVVGPDGRFELNYLKKGDGALPGTYKVVIYLPGVTGVGEVEEEEDENNPNLKKKPARKRKVPLPAKYSNPGQTPLTAVVEPKPNDITLTVPRR